MMKIIIVYLEGNKVGHVSKVSVVTGYPPSLVAIGTVALSGKYPFLLSS